MTVYKLNVIYFSDLNIEALRSEFIGFFSTKEAALGAYYRGRENNLVIGGRHEILPVKVYETTGEYLIDVGKTE